jgi:virginiamycin B lyase
MPPGALVEYHIPTHHSQPVFIAPAGDGNLWFTESAPNKIGRITTAGVITEFSAGVSSIGPNDIRKGPDGRAWFGTYGPDAIGRVAYDGTVQLFPIPSPTGHPEQLVGDKVRDAIWFTESQNQTIGEFSLATHAFTEFPVPPPSGGFKVHPVAIALDRSGNVWFSDNANSQVDEMSGSGTIMQRLDLPDSQGPSTLVPWRMTLGTGGDLWLVELTGGPQSHGSIARIRPSTGSLTTYYAPVSTYGFDAPYDAVAVSDGVWITENPVGIAHIGATGHFREYSNPFSGDTGITIGSDGDLWFVESGKNSIAKLDLSLLH